MRVQIRAAFWTGASIKQKSLLSADPARQPPLPAQSHSQPPVVKADWAGSDVFKQRQCWQTPSLDRYKDNNNIFITCMSNCGRTALRVQEDKSCESTGFGETEFYALKRE